MELSDDYAHCAGCEAESTERHPQEDTQEARAKLLAFVDSLPAMLAAKNKHNGNTAGDMPTVAHDAIDDTYDPQ